MLRTVYMSTCPLCSERASLLTIKHENGHVARAVACSSQLCRVSTGFSYGGIQEIVKRWNLGIALEKSDGSPFIMNDRPRALLAQLVDDGDDR
jgi:hypothetical protein